MTDNNNDGFKSKGFDYDSLVEDGLKDVVKKVLKITSETGLKEIVISLYLLMETILML